MAEFPALPIFTDAYLADTRHLSTLEHGAYLLLLMEAWRRPTCSLPDDDALLARLSGLTPEQWASIKDVVMSFWVIDGRSKTWRQKRLSKERDFVANQSRLQRDRVAKRWNKTKKEDTAVIPQGIPDRYRSDTPTPTPTLKKERETKVSPKKADSVLVKEALTEVLPEDVAQAFIDHRRTLKKPMTPRAAQMIAKKLTQASDPVACAEHSILKGWQDVFPEKQTDAPRSGGDQLDWFTGMREIQ